MADRKDETRYQAARPSSRWPVRPLPPADRALVRELNDSPVVDLILSAIRGFALILNGHRQVVAANGGLLEELGLKGPERVLGLRHGEALGCVRVERSPAGCGSSPGCALCGALLALLEREKTGETQTGECSLTTRSNGMISAHDFRVRATPARLGGQDVTVIVFREISAQKRREVLEGAFLHDLGNTVGGLHGWSSLLGDLDGDSMRDAAVRVSQLSERLVLEIRHQRALTAAEDGTLVLELGEMTASQLLEEVRLVFEGHARRLQALGGVVEAALFLEQANHHGERVGVAGNLGENLGQH